MPWHTCPASYGRGDTILPGRWGRVVLATGPSHPAWERENLLERIRSDIAAEAPSRLAAVFAHSDLASALEYAEPHEYVYEVEQPDNSVVADMLWITWIRESIAAGDVGRAERQAGCYWRGESTRDHGSHASPHWEIVTTDLLVVAATVRGPTGG